MNAMRVGVIQVVVVLVVVSSAVAEPKADKKDDRPKIVVAVPMGVATGAKTKVLLRGQRLDSVAEVRCSPASVKAKLVEKRSAGDIPRVGNTLAEVEVTLPPDFPASTLEISLVNASGEGNPHSLLVDRTPVVAEVEPNNGFAQAQAIRIGQTVAGVMDRGFDVDVYRFDGKAGQRVVAEVFAARYGSPLDSILTLYGDSGQLIAANDDLDESTTDSRVLATLPRDGTYFLAVIDANDRASPAHVYRLSLQLKP
jgi:hypothetical protein